MPKEHKNKLNDTCRDFMIHSCGGNNGITGCFCACALFWCFAGTYYNFKTIRRLGQSEDQSDLNWARGLKLLLLLGLAAGITFAVKTTPAIYESAYGAMQGQWKAGAATSALDILIVLASTNLISGVGLLFNSCCRAPFFEREKNRQSQLNSVPSINTPTVTLEDPLLNGNAGGNDARAHYGSTI